MGAKGRSAVYDVATQHGQVVIFNCHVPHNKRDKEYVVHLRMEYIPALETGPVIVVGDLNYHPHRQGAETEVNREVRIFVAEMMLQDVSYSGAPGLSHYPAPEGSAASRKDAVYADPRWFWGLTTGYMAGVEAMRDKEVHCPMIVTVEVKVGDPVDDKDN